jgi:hypothetical protein
VKYVVNDPTPSDVGCVEDAFAFNALKMDYAPHVGKRALARNIKGLVVAL